MRYWHPRRVHEFVHELVPFVPISQHRTEREQVCDEDSARRPCAQVIFQSGVAAGNQTTADLTLIRASRLAGGDAALVQGKAAELFSR